MRAEGGEGVVSDPWINWGKVQEPNLLIVIKAHAKKGEVTLKRNMINIFGIHCTEINGAHTLIQKRNANPAFGLALTRRSRGSNNNGSISSKQQYQQQSLTYCRVVARHRLGQHRVGPYQDIVTDDYVSQDLGTRSDDDAIANGGMSLSSRGHLQQQESSSTRDGSTLARHLA